MNEIHFPEGEPADVHRLDADGIVIRERVYPSGYTLGAHAHDVDVFSLALDYEWREWCDARPIDRVEGQVQLLPRGADHLARFTAPTRIFLVELSSAWKNANCFSEGAFAEPRTWRGNTRLSHAVRNAHAKFREGFASPDELAANIIGLLTTQGGKCGRIPSWLRLAQDYLSDSYLRPPSMRVLAAACDVRPASLSRAFARHYGCTPSEYARGLRLEWASVQLRDTNRSISLIALDAGFSDQPHFSRHFVRLKGTTPAQYRRAYRLGDR